MPTLTLPPQFALPIMPVRKFSVEEYHRMIDADILTENDAVELLDGWIVPKMPRKPHHDSTVQGIDDLLREVLPEGWGIRAQMAVTLEDSEPEPDIAVVLGNRKTFRHRHPGAADIGLVIEVADSSLTQDRTEKYRIYAKAGLPAYWIVNLVDGQVEVMTQPTSRSTYRKKSRYRAGETIPLDLGKDVRKVAVDDILEPDEPA